MAKTKFEYAAYISVSPGKVWNALIDPQMTEKYWQVENSSDWQAGSKWEHRKCDRKKTLLLVGRVVEAAAPRRLVLTWALPEDELDESKQSKVTIELEPCCEVTRMTVRHEGLEPGSEMLEGISDGWPKVVSSLKSLLETGRALPVLWEEPVEVG